MEGHGGSVSLFFCIYKNIRLVGPRKMFHETAPPPPPPTPSIMLNEGLGVCPLSAPIICADCLILQLVLFELIVGVTNVSFFDCSFSILLPLRFLL